MNGRADSLSMRWLMLPALLADAGRLPERYTRHCTRAERMASRRLHGSMPGIHVLRTDHGMALANWLSQDLVSLGWGLYLAGAWIYGGKLRTRIGDPIALRLARMLDTPLWLAILRSDEAHQGTLPPLRHLGDVMAAGGALMYEHCRHVMPWLGERLLQRFSPEISEPWRMASHGFDEVLRGHIAARVLQARPGAVA